MDNTSSSGFKLRTRVPTILTITNSCAPRGPTKRHFHIRNPYPHSSESLFIIPHLHHLPTSPQSTTYSHSSFSLHLPAAAAASSSSSLETPAYLCTMGKHCFGEGAVGLASIANTEPGTNSKPFFSRSRRNISYRSLSSLSSTSSSSSSSPRSRCEELREPHFLETCFLCKQHLGENDDIFMYQGDTPFCSEGCREKQIDLDEAKDKMQSLASSMKAMRIETTKSTSRKSENCTARTNAVAAC